MTYQSATAQSMASGLSEHLSAVRFRIFASDMAHGGATKNGWCFAHLWRTADDTVIGAWQCEPWAPDWGLIQVQANFLAHYVRLQAAAGALERRLGKANNWNSAEFVEMERRRLGAELHTGIGQLLSAIRLQTELIGSQAPAAAGGLERIAGLAAEALDRVRSLSRQFHPPSWQALDIETALRHLWDLSGIAEAFDARLITEALPRQPSLAATVLLYNTAQEAVSNLIRHSHATRVETRLFSRRGFAVLRFEDNGMFDPASLFISPESESGGIGLRMIRDQAEALGGSFLVEGGRHGATIEVSIPLESEFE